MSGTAAVAPKIAPATLRHGLKEQGEMLETTEQGIIDARILTVRGRTEVATAAQEGRRRQAGFQTRQGGAKAKMDADAKAQMGVGSARDVKTLRLGKLGRIAVRRGP